MNFEFTEEQTMFRDMAREFSQREVAPTARERDKEQKFFPEIIKKMGEQGLFAIMVPPEYGGLGLDWTTMGLVAAEIAAVDFSVGLQFFTHTSLEIMPILTAGTEEQKQKYIPGLMTGELSGCTAAVEPNAGSDATAIETTAVLNGDEWVLNGNKTWITNAVNADFAVVLAQTDKTKGTKGICTFIVDKDSPGYQTFAIHDKLGCRSSDTGQLFFRDCRIPKSNLLGPVGKGMKTALTCIEHTRYGISWLAVGVMKACIDASVKYAQERKQFGKTLAEFQLVQERVSEMVVAYEASRMLSLNVAYLKDKGENVTRETAIAKYHNLEQVMKTTRTTLELHGAYGFTNDLPCERFYRDMVGPLIFGGTAHVQKLVIGRFTLGADAIR